MTMYADGNSKIGQVKVYRCPHCQDGVVTAALRAKLVKLEAVAEVANMVINHGDDCGDLWIPELREALQKLGETK